jgi:thiamine-monophosphate kinase
MSKPPLGPRLQGEAAIIQSYLAPLATGFPGALGLSDDCATFTPTPGHDIVMKTDPVAAGVHFLSSDDAADVAWKALAVNVSDLAAKAAVPRAYLMALSFPEAPTHAWMARFAAGLAEAQAAFAIHLAGGDTDRRPGPLTVSITVLGEVPAGRMVRRGAARLGDVLYVTGTLGDAALGLRLLREPDLAARWHLASGEVAALIARYRRPRPRLALREALLAHAHAAMDLSDGLYKDLCRMAAASGCDALVRLPDLPLSGPCARALSHDPSLWQDIAASGDDYEVLAAIPPEAAPAFEAAARAAGTAADPPFTVTRIGLVPPDPGVIMVGPDGRAFEPARPGWDHF